jgi:uncharacterized protein YhfF
MPAGDLPVIEFAFPGPLRDQLVAAILTGEKTTTTGLLADYERENEPLPAPGLRQVVIDSAGRPVAVIETTAVRVMRLADVDLGHAQGEGEGYASVAEWRAGHHGRRRHPCRSAGIPAHTRLKTSTNIKTLARFCRRPGGSSPARKPSIARLCAGVPDGARAVRRGWSRLHCPCGWS